MIEDLNNLSNLNKKIKRHYLSLKKVKFIIKAIKKN